jgi:hypothetical protein
MVIGGWESHLHGDVPQGYVLRQGVGLDRSHDLLEKKMSWRALVPRKRQARFGGERLVFSSNQDLASYPTTYTPRLLRNQGIIYSP